MPKYNVILYPLVTLKITDIEASSPAEAVRLAEEKIQDSGYPLETIFDRKFHSGVPAVSSSYADKIHSYLVDEVGPDGGLVEGGSRDLCADGETPVGVARAAYQEMFKAFAIANPERARFAAAYVE